MKPYRGIIRINCSEKSGCTKKEKSIGPNCMGCQSGVTEIIDHEGKSLYEHKQVTKPAAKKKTGGK